MATSAAMKATSALPGAAKQPAGFLRGASLVNSQKQGCATKAQTRIIRTTAARYDLGKSAAVKKLKKQAEGPAYGKDSGEGNGTAYAALAAGLAATAGIFAVAPHTAAELLFGAAGRPHDYLHEPLFRILALGFLSAATTNWVQKGAAEEGSLDEDIHRRANASLSFFAAANLSIATLSYLTNPILTPPGGILLAGLSAGQWLVAGRNYAKYSETGANPIGILATYFKDITSIRVDGLNSGIYAALTLSFIGAGFAYLFAPVPTLTAIFGPMAGKGPEDVFLWQLAGAGVATVVGPIAYTQWEAAIQNNFSEPAKRTLMTGLAAASAGHIAVLAPLLGTDRAGPLLLPLGIVWGISAVASALIAIKPKE